MLFLTCHSKIILGFLHVKQLTQTIKLEKELIMHSRKMIVTCLVQSIREYKNQPKYKLVVKKIATNKSKQ